eukprot:363429-Chlamydomonas_euryale.AAC.34
MRNVMDQERAAPTSIGRGACGYSGTCPIRPRRVTPTRRHTHAASHPRQVTPTPSHTHAAPHPRGVTPTRHHTHASHLVECDLPELRAHRRLRNLRDGKQSVVDAVACFVWVDNLCGASGLAGH